MKVLALDIGGTSIKSALVKDGELTQKKETPSDARSGADFLLKNVYSLIESYRDYDIIGVSTTGQVDSEKGVITFANENVPRYTGTRLKDLLTEKFQKPVLVENDVNAAAIGEGRFGAGKNHRDFLCLTYGTGVGGAIILNGQIYKGMNGSAGEFGHMITHAGGHFCGCGQQGCYEQYASTTALVRNAQEADSSWTDGRQLFASLDSGDPAAIRVVENWIDDVLCGLTGLIHIFNPSCVILGGGIMNEPYILNQINRKISSRIMESYKAVEIKAAQLGNHAGIYGMLALALQSE